MIEHLILKPQKKIIMIEHIAYMLFHLFFSPNLLFINSHKHSNRSEE